MAIHKPKTALQKTVLILFSIETVGAATFQESQNPASVPDGPGVIGSNNPGLRGGPEAPKGFETFLRLLFFAVAERDSGQGNADSRTRQPTQDHAAAGWLPFEIRAGRA